MCYLYCIVKLPEKVCVGQTKCIGVLHVKKFYNHQFAVLLTGLGF